MRCVPVGAAEQGGLQARNNGASSCPGAVLAAGRLLWAHDPENARSYNQEGGGREERWWLSRAVEWAARWKKILQGRKKNWKNGISTLLHSTGASAAGAPHPGVGKG